MKLRLSVGVILSLLLVGSMALGATAAVGGSLDTTFGGTGVVQTAIGPTTNWDNSYSTAIQKDGKVVDFGESDMGGATGYDFSVARYTSAGVLDTTFGTTGKVTTAIAPAASGDYAFDGLVQPDGKILAVGEASMGGATGDDFALVRYNADGTLDTTFGTTGKVTTNMSSAAVGHDDAYAVKLQSDGMIVVAGEADMGASGYDIAVARYTSAGVLDTTFDTDGKKTIAVGPAGNDDYAGGLAIQSDGKIVVGGTCAMAANEDMCFVRLSSAGALDTTFSGDGIATVDFPGALDDGMWNHGVAIDAYGNIVGAGNHDNNAAAAVARLTSAGVLDTTFSTDGMASLIWTSDGYFSTVLIQTDGRILGIGEDETAAGVIGVARFNFDGTLDATFDTDGIVTTAAGISDSEGNGGALQKDGAIVVSGHSHTVAGDGDFTTARYNYGTYLYRADAIINKVGNDIYWGGQKVKVKVMSGKTKTAKINVQNDGTSADSFAIEGSNSKGKAANAFAVSYWSGSKNITKKVTKGTYMTKSLATGEKVTIKMKIKAVGSSGHKTFKVSATSKGYAGSVDTVKAKAKIT